MEAFLSSPWGAASLVLGGLGLFLLGLDESAQAFRDQLGGKSREIFQRLSRSPFASFFLGTGLSALSQSSTAATSLAVGLVNAQILSLSGAVTVMMGASVGTTVVTFLLTADVARYAPLVLGLAVFGERLSTGTARRAARAIRGLALLLSGMFLIKLGVAPLTARVELRELLMTLGSSPELLGLVALLLTAVTQSSSLVVALALALLSKGLLPPEGALPVILGSHVGSSATVLLAGLGGRPQARALAWSTLLYKVTGAGAALLLAPLLQGFFATQTSPVPLRFALLQALILWGNAALLLPAASLLARVSQRIARFAARETPGTPRYLDEAALPFPHLALTLLSREMVRLANALEQYLTLVLFDRSRSRERAALREGLPLLAEACSDFLLALPPCADRRMETCREELFDDLRSLKQLADQLATRFGPRSDDMAEKFLGTDPELALWRNFASTLEDLVRYSLGTFVLGETDPSPLAQRLSREFDSQEQLLRAQLRGRQGERVTRETLGAWEWLDEASALARSARELSRRDAAQGLHTFTERS